MAKQRSISSLKKVEYEDGAILTLKNAENLFEIAQHSHSLGINGNSISLLITSLEELAKSAYLMIKAHHPNVVIKELDAMFRDHRTKHQIIMRLFNKLVIGNVHDLPEEEQNDAALSVGIVYSLIIIVLSFKGVQFDIEEIRKRGFYVNFNKNDDGKIWNSPDDLIDTKLLGEYLEIGENIFNSVKKDLFSGELSDVHTKKYLEHLNDENVYFRKTHKFSGDLRKTNKT